jgi:hypothetical protein
MSAERKALFFPSAMLDRVDGGRLDLNPRSANHRELFGTPRRSHISANGASILPVLAGSTEVFANVGRADRSRLADDGIAASSAEPATQRQSVAAAAKRIRLINNGRGVARTWR